MAANLGVLVRKALDLVLGQVTAQASVELAREVVVELRKQLDVEEEHGGGGEARGGGIEKDLWAVVFVAQVFALAGLDGLDAEVEDVGAVAEKDRLSA